MNGFNRRATGESALVSWKISQKIPTVNPEEEKAWEIQAEGL